MRRRTITEIIRNGFRRKLLRPPSRRSASAGAAAAAVAGASEWLITLLATAVAGGILTTWEYEQKEEMVEEEVQVGETSTVPIPVNYDEVRSLIRSRLWDKSYEDECYGPILVKLCMNACMTFSKYNYTGGVQGGTIRHSEQLAHKGNEGLHIAVEFLERIREEVPGISFADLHVLAAYESIEALGGPHIEFTPGRVDFGEEKVPHDNRLLRPWISGPTAIRKAFYRMGLNDREILALIGGGHSIGTKHLDRSGYSGSWTLHPNKFGNDFLCNLWECDWYTDTDRKTGRRQLVDEEGGQLRLLLTDWCLVLDVAFRQYIELYVQDEDIFFQDFAKTFKKVTELGVFKDSEKIALDPRIEVEDDDDSFEALPWASEIIDRSPKDWQEDLPVDPEDRRKFIDTNTPV